MVFDGCCFHRGIWQDGEGLPIFRWELFFLGVVTLSSADVGRVKIESDTIKAVLPRC